MEERKNLIRTALGKQKADLVIVNGNLVNVYSGELLEGASIAITKDKIASVAKDVIPAIGEDTEVIDASGKIVAPGFIDGHFHLYMSLEEFIEHSLSRGTTTAFVELDLAHFLGYQAADALLENMKNQPMKLFGLATFYSSQPQFLGQTEFALSLEDYARLLARDDVAALGESVWTGVLEEDERVLTNIAAALRNGKLAEGHSSGIKGNKLAAFAASGISSCHESINLPEAMERLRLGFHVMIREGSIRRDLEAISGIKDQNIDFRRLCLATDSVNAEDLLSLGHMDFIVQKAINLGIDPIKVFQMASLNTAEHFRKDHVMGGIAPGRCADIVILPSLKKIECEMVISNGRIVAQNGQSLVHARKGTYPESVLNSIRLPRALQPQQFDVPAGDRKNKATVRVIKLISELITREVHALLPVVNGSVLPDPANDILKVSVVERLRNAGRIVTGFVQGFGLRSGAMACSYSWDAGSPLAVIGANDLDMSTAVNRIVSLQGGIVVVDQGRILAEAPHPVGGLMPVNKIEETAQEFRNINQAVKQLGSPLANPYMTLQTLAGTTMPFFRICLQGLVDLKDQKIVDLFVA